MVVKTNDGHRIGDDVEQEDGWLIIDKDANQDKFIFQNMEFFMF